MTPAVLPLLLILMTGQAPSNPAADPFTRAQALYDSAAYEEALSLLISVEDTTNFGRVEQYRALCLLALGRSTEAEGALEQIVRREPLFNMDVREVSPRLVLMYREVRQRLLPTVARDLYARGKANFDAHHYSDAAAQLQDLITLLGSDEPAVAGPGLPELRQLAEGFLKLSLAEPDSAPASPATTRNSPSSSTGIYSTADRGVIAPVEIVRYVPRRVELVRHESPGLYQGLIEVVIDETGAVQSPQIRRSITPTYDVQLLEAARHWRFQPATLNGRPVPYRKSFEIIVHSR
ncbi:MAG: energy transducer TonB [Vicinamibacterales bacterium]